MRTEGSSRDKSWPLIRRSGIRLLYKHGFHGMTLRALAAESGMQAGSLYNHFKNKNEFLTIIMRDILQELLDNISDAIIDEQDPKKKLEKFVSVMVAWHAERKKEAMMTQSELRSLPKPEYHEIGKIRKEFEILLLAIVTDGVARGLFRTSDPRLSAIMIINMLSSIANWYQADGRLEVDELTAQYQDAVLRLLDAR